MFGEGGTDIIMIADFFYDSITFKTCFESYRGYKQFIEDIPNSTVTLGMSPMKCLYPLYDSKHVLKVMELLYSQYAVKVCT